MEKGKKQLAYELIKEKILTGELAPSTDLSEEKLISELGISRTPIREAIQKLSEEGFVIIFPRKGTIVSEISLDLIRWTYEARRINEPYVTKCVCGHLSLKWLLKMQRSFQAILKAGNTPEILQKYVELDRELHGTILEAFDNIFIKSFMRNVYDHSHRLRIKTGNANMDYKRATEEHMVILEALIENDPEKAEQAALAHVLESTKTAYQYS